MLLRDIGRSPFPAGLSRDRVAGPGRSLARRSRRPLPSGRLFGHFLPLRGLFGHLFGHPIEVLAHPRNDVTVNASATRDIAVTQSRVAPQQRDRLRVTLLVLAVALLEPRPPRGRAAGRSEGGASRLACAIRSSSAVRRERAARREHERPLEELVCSLLGRLDQRELLLQLAEEVERGSARLRGHEALRRARLERLNLEVRQGRRGSRCGWSYDVVGTRVLACARGAAAACAAHVDVRSHRARAPARSPAAGERAKPRASASAHRAAMLRVASASATH